MPAGNNDCQEASVLCPRNISSTLRAHTFTTHKNIVPVTAVTSHSNTKQNYVPMGSIIYTSKMLP